MDRARGTHDLAIDNRGNARLNAEVEGTDADRQLKFDIKPPGVVVEPGMAGFAKVRVSPVKRFWRGQPKTRPFQLFVRPEGGTPITIDGTLLQESVLPSWFLKALLALIVLLIAPRPDLAAAAQADASTPRSPTPSRRPSRASRRTSTTPSSSAGLPHDGPARPAAVAVAASTRAVRAPSGGGTPSGGRGARRRRRRTPARRHPGPRQPHRRPPRPRAARRSSPRGRCSSRTSCSRTRTAPTGTIRCCATRRRCCPSSSTTSGTTTCTS